MIQVCTLLMKGYLEMNTQKAKLYITTTTATLCLIATILIVDLFSFGMFSEVSTGELISQFNQLKETSENFEVIDPAVITSTHDRLQETVRDKILIDEGIFLFICFVNIASIFLLFYSILIPETKKEVKPKYSSKTKNPVFANNSYAATTFDKVINEIKRSVSKIDEALNIQPTDSAKSSSTAEVNQSLDKVIKLEAAQDLIKAQITNAENSIQDTNKRVFQLLTHCQDSADLAAGAKLEWNTMGNKLRQVKQGYDKAKIITGKV